MPAPSPSVTFINKLPLLAFLLPNVVAWGEEGGGGEGGGGRVGMVQAAVPSTTLCPAQPALASQFLGDSGSWG